MKREANSALKQQCPCIKLTAIGTLAYNCTPHLHEIVSYHLSGEGRNPSPYLSETTSWILKRFVGAGFSREK